MARIPGVFLFITLVFPAAGNSEGVPQNCPMPDAALSQCGSPLDQQGQIAFVDPETGEVLMGEAAAEAALEQRNAEVVETLNNQLAETFSTEGLTEERTETGAVALDLEGRFQNPLVATMDAQGGIRVEHLGSAPTQH